MRYANLKAPLSKKELLEKQGWEYVGEMKSGLHRFRRPESEVSFSMSPESTKQKQES